MTAKYKYLIAFTLVSLLLIPLTVTLAQSEPVRIYITGKEYTVSSQDELVLYHGWAACSEGLVNDYFDSAHHTVFINGELMITAQEKGKSYWGEPYKFDRWDPSVCLWNVEIAWAAYWEYDFGTLEPGDYEIVWERTFDFTITDGADSDGNGVIDTWEGFVRLPATSIHVVEPPDVP